MTSTCPNVTWLCPHCKTYSSDVNLLKGAPPTGNQFGMMASGTAGTGYGGTMNGPYQTGGVQQQQQQQGIYGNGPSTSGAYGNPTINSTTLR